MQIDSTQFGAAVFRWKCSALKGRSVYFRELKQTKWTELNWKINYYPPRLTHNVGCQPANSSVRSVEAKEGFYKQPVTNSLWISIVSATEEWLDEKGCH